jgi:tetratricopeptide (TPR) repeat protein
MYGIRGEWAAMFDVRSRGLSNIPETAKESVVYSGLFGRFAVGWVLAGRNAEAEEHSRATMAINRKIGIVDFTGTLDDLVFSSAFQGKFHEARDFFKQSHESSRTLFDRTNPVSLNFYGMALLREGNLQEAENYLQASWTLNKELDKELGPRRNPPENLQWLALLYELKKDWGKAEEYNNRSLEYRWIGRQYYICAALTSLVRIKHSQGDLTAIPPLAEEAEKLAQQYEYNDLLASLRLTQGHLIVEESKPSEMLSALDYYKQSIIYALRYNRFLLDELLSGRAQGTPLQPIIPFCLKCGDEGKKMLFALRSWWATGVNEVDTPRPDTISPLPNGIPLLEAEKLARGREQGDGSIQRNVLEQLEAAIH